MRSTTLTKVKSFVSVTSFNQAFTRGYGSEFAPNSIWTGINAITQVETSTRGTTAAKGRAQFARGTFGAGAAISRRAFAVAAELVGA